MGLPLCLLLVARMVRSTFAFGLKGLFHPLCGDWPCLWGDGPARFGVLPAVPGHQALRARYHWNRAIGPILRHTFPRPETLLRSALPLFPCTAVLLAYHQFTRGLDVYVSCSWEGQNGYKPTLRVQKLHIEYRHSLYWHNVRSFGTTYCTRYLAIFGPPTQLGWQRWSRHIQLTVHLILRIVSNDQSFPPRPLWN
jgi:hypothetical protein